MGVVGILRSGIAGELDYRNDGVDLQFGSPCASKQGDVQVWIGDLDFGPVYGYADGNISNKFIEDSEELEIVIADRDEVRRILREEKVAIMCAYQLMHFLVDEEPFAFLGV